MANYNYVDADGNFKVPDWILIDKGKVKYNHTVFADKIVDMFCVVALPTAKNTLLYFYVDELGIYKKCYEIDVTGNIQSYIRKLINDFNTIRDEPEKEREEILKYCPVDFDTASNLMVNETDINKTYKAIFRSENIRTLKSLDEFNRNENCIVFKNGVLNLKTMQLMPHSPTYMSTIQIPVEWNTNCNIEPKVFTEYINHLANYDADQKQSLLEAIGLAISNINVGQRCKKSLFLKGDGNCGKSVFLMMLEQLIGTDNYVSMPWSRLKERFALADLFGKRIAADPDCQAYGENDVSQFKLISSADILTAENKYEPSFTFQYRGIYIVCTNILPDFSGDTGKWVYDRMLIVQCGDEIPVEKRNKRLLTDLLQESESIVFLAVQALKQLIERDYRMTVSEASKQLVSNYVINNNIYLSFIEECCMPIDKLNKNSDEVVTAKDMWVAVQRYVEDAIGRKANRRAFEAALRNKYNITDAQDVKASTGKKRYYKYITLKPEYVEEYLQNEE